MTRQRTALYIVAVMAVFMTGFVVGSKDETRASLLTTSEKQPQSVDFDPVWKAWRLLDEKFVSSTSTTAINDEDKVWGLISGLAESYNDPYTVFMPPQLARSFEEEIQGEFGGIGIEMGIRDGILTVIAPLKGTPAERAGIMTGDLIVKVNGASTQQMSVDDAVEIIRGEVGSEVTLTVARESEPEFLDIHITRDIIQVPTLAWRVEEGGVFVIELYNFGGTAEREVRGALREFILGGYSKLVLDLRGNPGGYLSTAVDVASWFLPMGTVVVTEQYGDAHEPTIHRSKGTLLPIKNLRVAVLVDGGSASASEILAGALQEHSIAKLIGTQTFGKGSVQELVEVTPTTNLKITIAQWLTPNGNSISEGGLTPDLIIDVPHDAPEGDPQLKAAIDYLRTGELRQPAPLTGASADREAVLEEQAKVE